MNREEYDQFLEDAEALSVEERYNKIAEAEVKRRGVTFDQLLEEAVEQLMMRARPIVRQATGPLAWGACLDHCIYVVHFQERQEVWDVGNIQMGLKCTLDLSKEDSTWVMSEWYPVDMAMRELLDRL